MKPILLIAAILFGGLVLATAQVVLLIAPMAADSGSLAAPPSATSPVTATVPPGEDGNPTSGAAPTRRTYPGLRNLPGTPSSSTAGLPNGNLPVGPTNVSPNVFDTNGPSNQAAGAGRTTGANNGAAAQATGRSNGNTAAAGRSNITPVQLQNINQLDLDLNGLGVPVRGSAEVPGLFQTLQAAPVAAVRPSAAMINTLGSNLASVLPTLNLTAPQRRQLAIDINMALNSGNLSGTEAQRVIDDARALLQGSAVNNPNGVSLLVGDLAVVVGEVQGNLARTATAPQPASPGSQTQVGNGAGTQTGAGSGGSARTTPAAGR